MANNNPDAQAIAAAIQQGIAAVVANLQQQQQPAVAAQQPVDLDMISPFQGGALALGTRSGQNLYFEGSKELGTKFTGKVEDMFPFLQELKNRARHCFWDQGPHAILTVNHDGTDYNVLDQFAKVSLESVVAAKDARENGNDVRARQNSRMMYACVYASTTEEARTRFVAEEQMDEDGPLLFFKLVYATYTASFSSAQSVRNQLFVFHPKKVKYDVTNINNFIRLAIKKLRSAAGENAAVANSEIFYHQYKIYRKIKSPVEWTSKLLFLENANAANADYTPEDLFRDTEEYFCKLSDEGRWRPSDKTPEETAMAMVATQKKGGGDDKDSDKKKGDKKSPPFANTKGKEGESKKWNGETYYYCPAKHRHSQWHKFPVSECNTHKKWKAGGKKGGKDGNNDAKKGESNSGDRITVDRDALKRGMAGLFPDGQGGNAEDLAEALLATLKGE